MSLQKHIWSSVLVSCVVSGVLDPAAALAQALYPLDATLCAAIGAAPPDYNTRLGPNAPGAAFPMWKKTLTASCNDGSPAVMYLRPAPAGSPDADKWIIFLQGGGGCRDADQCLERFCHSAPVPKVFEVAGKMSSLGAPDAIDPPEGILAARAWNNFRGYNAVNVHYCSSDNWIGSAASKTLTPATLTSYPIEFNGEAIVNDVLATLRSGPTFPDPGGGDEPMPDLDSASLVLWAGESAGAGGARHALDRVAAELSAVGVTVKGVMDAGFDPVLSDPALVWAAPNPYVSYDDMAQQLVQPVVRTFWEADDTALDQSCLASGIDEWYCMDTTYTQLYHITTPTFVRQDLTDFLARETPLTWGLFPSVFDYAVANANQFSLLPGGNGWFAPNCSGHVQIQGRGFRRTFMRFGSGLEFHDVLWNWLQGAGLTQEIQPDIPAGAPYRMSRRCS